ncbi:phage tail protein [Fictibacillus fluitans]|uniref:Phage tail protein n=1 Tax=Fictibacillus fluitans TaxID=3058422 RepID=A0ABT8HX14_9BACL|nr:phage tail protein [Fictibacillus sp. NE201]MDN4525316.1 phage tail protein [Fictibacillus sp. NE201]
MHVRDLSGNEYMLQATSTMEYELNGNQVLSFTAQPNKVNLQFLQNLTNMWQVVDDEGTTYRIVYARKKGEGDLLTAEVKAIPMFFDVFDSDRIYEEYNRSMTAAFYFDLLFKDTGFTFVLVDAFGSQDWEGWGKGETKLGLFKDGLDRYGAEFKLTGTVVYLQARVGRDTSFMYRHRLNASNIVHEADASAYWTYAKGFGNYDEGDEANAKLKRTYTSPLASIIGIRHAPPIYDGRITVAATMDASLKELVDESLKISVSADLQELRRQNYPLAQPETGDRVFLIDERIGLNEEVRVVNLVIVKDWLGNVLDLNVTFGSEGLTKRYQSNISSAIKDMNDVLAGKKPLPYSALDEAVRQATEDLKRAQTELVFDNGIIAREQNNPNNIVLFNSAGIGISSDGGNTFRTAITGKGMVADVITAGTLRGVLISGVDIVGSTFQSTDKKTEFFVESGNMKLNHINTGRNVSISPDGIYGYNTADGSQRFRMDKLLVTSAALGTSNANVYIAPDSNNEVRIVNVNSIPSDGVAENYTYRPIRALGLRFGPGANGYIGTDGELRITSTGFVRDDGSIIYRNIRGGEFYGTAFITRTESAWIGTDSFLNVVAKGTAQGTLDPIYRNLRAGDIWGTAFITSTENFYIGCDGVLKVVNKGMSDIYRPVWAYSFENKSLRELKTDIEVFDQDVLPIIENMNVYQYRMTTDDPDSKLQLGVLVDEAPEEIKGSDDTTISQYPYSSYILRGLQQVIGKVNDLQKEINDLKGMAS